MGFPESNLPPLDGQRYYTLVHQLHLNSTDPIHNYCNRSNANENEYYGFSVSILHPLREDILADVRHIGYTVYLEGEEYKVEKKAAIMGEIASIFSNMSSTLLPKLTRSTQAAMDGSIQPTQLGPMYDFLNTMYTADIAFDEVEAKASRAIMQQITHERHADTCCAWQLVSGNVSVKLHPGTQTVRKEIYDYVNNTYLNVVHDCERMCIQSVLSDNSSFMSEQNIDNYGLLCVRRLLETRTQGTTVMNNELCNTCILSVSGIIIGVSAVSISAASLFATFNNSKYAKTVRSYISRTIQAIRGTQNVHYDVDE